MKKFLQKVWRVIRLIFGVELALAALGGVIVSIQSPEVGNIVLTIVCAGVAYLLLRRKKPKAAQIRETQLLAAWRMENKVGMPCLQVICRCHQQAPRSSADGR